MKVLEAEQRREFLDEEWGNPRGAAGGPFEARWTF